MPKLVTFAVCGRVIIDANNIVTLVELMQGLGVNVPGPLSLEKGPPRNAVIPHPWSVYSLWRPGGKDIGPTFTQIIEIRLPDGSEFPGNKISFQFAPGKQHQISINFPGFPIGQPGDVTVKLWLELDSKPATEIHDWVVPVTHVPVPSTPAQAN